MNLIQTIKEMPSVKLKTDKKEAQRLFLRAVEKHELFNRTMKKARQEAFESGLYFLRARAAFDHGEWGEFCSLYGEKISPRTIQFYMLLADQAIKYVCYLHPTLKDLDKIKALALDTVLVSALPLVQLCRELGHVLKFGGYFAEDYENKKKIANGQQFEFSFDDILKPLDLLCHLGDENYEFNVPDGKDQTDAIGEIETKLETALTRVRQIKKHGKAIET